MAVVDRDISPKPVVDETVLDVLNREIVPVARQMRAALNRHLLAYSVTVGDGVETSFTITHNLGTEDTIWQLKTISTGVLVSPATYFVTVTGENTGTVLMGLAPGVNDLRISVRV